MEENGNNCGARCNPARGDISGVQPAAARDPAFDCCCHDACPGDVFGPHCNADLGSYFDALIASTRANASTVSRLPDFDRTADGSTTDDRDTDYADRDDGSDADAFNESGNRTARDSGYREPGYGET